MSISLLGLLCAVQYHVTCSIVMFCCFPSLTVGDILLPEFFIVRICSSTGVVPSWVLTVGANYSSHHVSSFLTGVNCFSHPISMVLTVQATILLALSQVLTVWATLFSMVLTVQATMFLAFSWVLTVWVTQYVFSMVLTVQATMFLAFSGRR